MARYDYECQACNITTEVVHGMTESPEIKCEKCGSIMKKAITGGCGYIMKSGSTRRRTDKARYGKKKGFSQSTPTESAQVKAEQKLQEKKNQYNPSDPYGAFRD